MHFAPRSSSTTASMLRGILPRLPVNNIPTTMSIRPRRSDVGRVPLPVGRCSPSATSAPTPLALRCDECTALTESKVHTSDELAGCASSCAYAAIPEPCVSHLQMLTNCHVRQSALWRSQSVGVVFDICVCLHQTVAPVRARRARGQLARRH